MHKCTDDIPKMIIDQNAQTIAEMMQEVPHGDAWMSRCVKDMIAKGKWEKVWKKVNGRCIPAYRPKRK